MTASPSRTVPTDDLPVAWTALPLSALPPHSVYALLQLRCSVFVVEQACAYLDPDGRDLADGVLQLLGHDASGALTACARLLPPGVAYEQPSIGRVVVAPAARGRGLAHALMRESLRLCAAHWPGRPVLLGAQQHLAGFYAQHGFAVVSEPYLEDGIPHVHMRREAAE